MPAPSSQKELAAQFEKLRQKLPAAIKKNGNITLPDDLLNAVKGAVRKYRTSKNLIPTEYITDLVPLIDTDDYGTCSRLSVKIFITFAEAILQTESCRPAERGMYLLGAGLYHATSEPSQERSIRADKIDIGKDCMYALLVYFTDANKSVSTRRWVGVLLIQLLEDCETNAQRLVEGSGGAIRMLGKLVIEEVNEIIRLVCAKVVKATLDAGIPRAELWPVGMNPSVYESFPDGSSKLWQEKFESYVSKLRDMSTIQIPQPTGNMYFCHSLTTAPEHHIGAHGMNFSVFIEQDKISILCPITPEAFYNSLEIPLDLVTKIRADLDLMSTASKRLDDLCKDIVIELENREDKFCYKDSAIVELASVRMAFPTEDVQDVENDLKGAIKELTAEPKTNLHENLRFKEPGSSVQKPNANEVPETQEGYEDDLDRPESRINTMAAASQRSTTSNGMVPSTKVQVSNAGSSKRSRIFPVKGTSEAALDELPFEEASDIATSQRSSDMPLRNSATELALDKQPMSVLDEVDEDGNASQLQTAPLIMSTTISNKQRSSSKEEAHPGISPNSESRVSDLSPAERASTSRKEQVRTSSAKLSTSPSMLDASTSKASEWKKVAHEMLHDTQDDTQLSLDPDSKGGQIEALPLTADTTSALPLLPVTRRSCGPSSESDIETDDTLSRRLDGTVDNSNIPQKKAVRKARQAAKPTSTADATKSKPTARPRARALKVKTPLQTGNSKNISQGVKLQSTAGHKLVPERDEFDIPDDEIDPKSKSSGSKPKRTTGQSSKARVNDGKSQQPKKLQKADKKKNDAMPAMERPKPSASQRVSQRAAAKKARQNLRETDENEDDFAMDVETVNKGSATTSAHSTKQASKADPSMGPSEMKAQAKNGSNAADLGINPLQHNEAQEVSLPMYNGQQIEDLSDRFGIYNATPRRSLNKAGKVFKKAQMTAEREPRATTAEMGMNMAKKLGVIIAEASKSDREEHKGPGPLRSKNTDQIDSQHAKQQSKPVKDTLSSKKLAPTRTQFIEPRASRTQPDIAEHEVAEPQNLKAKLTKPEAASDFYKSKTSTNSPSSQNSEAHEDVIAFQVRKFAADARKDNHMTTSETSSESEDDDVILISNKAEASLPVKQVEKEQPKIIANDAREDVIQGDEESPEHVLSQSASTEEHIAAMLSKMSGRSKPAGGKVALRPSDEKENDNVALTPATPQGRVPPGRALKRKAPEVNNASTTKRRLLESNKKSQQSPLRRSSRLQDRFQAEEAEATLKVKKRARRQQPLASANLRRSPRLEAQAIEASTTSIRALLQKTPLVNDDLIRKPPVISFGPGGPRNQGASNESRVSGHSKAKEGLGSREQLPSGGGSRWNRSTRDSIRDTGEGNDEPAPILEYTEAKEPINHTSESSLKRKRSKGGFGELLGSKNKRQNVSPLDMAENEEDKLLEPGMPAKRVPIALERQPSSKLGSQSSRVDLNGSPLAILRTAPIDHISKLKKKLQNIAARDDECVADIQVDAILKPTRVAGAESSTTFGRRIVLSSITKPKPASPEKEKIRYVPHKKNLRTGAYEEIGSKEAVAPEKTLADPFVEKQNRRSSNFMQRLQAQAEPKKAQAEHKKSNIDDVNARILQAVSQIFVEVDQDEDSGSKQVERERLQTEKLTEKLHRAEGKPSMLKTVDHVYGLEDEATLVNVEDSEPRQVSSPAGLTSGSSNASPSGRSRPPLTEASSNKEWNMELRPHYKGYHDFLHRQINMTLMKLQGKEDAVAARIGEYRCNGTDLLNAMDENRQIEREKISQDLEGKKSRLVKVFHEATEYVGRSVDEIETMSLHAYEQGWETRQTDIDRIIEHARRSLGL